MVKKIVVCLGTFSFRLNADIRSCTRCIFVTVHIFMHGGELNSA